MVLVEQSWGILPSYLYSVLIRKIFTCKENIEIKWTTGLEFFWGISTQQHHLETLCIKNLEDWKLIQKTTYPCFPLVNTLDCTNCWCHPTLWYCIYMTMICTNNTKLVFEKLFIKSNHYQTIYIFPDTQYLRLHL